MSAVEQMLGDPANFLHSIDLDRSEVRFLRTDAATLRTAPFVDGRTPLSTDGELLARLGNVLAVDLSAPPVDRLVFNCSFCGSTLLSRLLDVPGRSLALKEPRVLTDLAAWTIFGIRDRRPLDRLRPALSIARAALRRRFDPDEAVVVKVASQGNVLLDTLVEQPQSIRPLFLTISRAGFLRAIFRGGVERMHYAARIAWHMATGEPGSDDGMRDALRAGGDPLRKAANLAILARHFQVKRFRRAAAAGGWGAGHVIDFDDITRDPVEAATTAARALQLDIATDVIARNADFHARRYAKRNGIPFDAARQRATDQAILADHRAVFDDALRWANDALGPELRVTG